MQDFVYGRVKAQEAAPQPYMLYNKEQNAVDAGQRSETLRDFEYFRSMYPARVKEIQILVAKECDGMDYEGSPIFDEYPDRLMLEQLSRRVQQQVAAQASPATAGETVRPEEMKEVETYEAAPQSGDIMPRMPYGPLYIVQSVSPENGTYQTWEMEEGRIEAEDRSPAEAEPVQQAERAQQVQQAERAEPAQQVQQLEQAQQTETESNEEADSERIQEVGDMRRPWGPPPPPPRPVPPPPRPWGPPPPPPRPWGPPPPPPRPWGPPPPPPRPWGPPPPPRPGNRVDLDDVIRLLLFNEIQGRRCRNRNCR